MTWIVTYTGRKVDLFDPQPDMIDVQDVAHALAHICRFGGHTIEHYSVAQHSVLVAAIVSHDQIKHFPVVSLAALLHDAAEAYLGDMVRPLKEGLANSGEIRRMELKMELAIAARFGFESVLLHHEAVKRADEIALMTEKRDVLSVHASAVPWTGRQWPKPQSDYIRPVPAVVAKAEFVHVFDRLIKCIGERYVA